MPGTLASRSDHPTAIKVLGYSAGNFKEFACDSFAEAKKHENEFEVVWVDVTGLGDVELLQEFATEFKIHSLTLEDVVNVHQRAKFESFEHYDFMVTRMVSYEETLESLQISVFISGKYVISFQERVGDCLEPLRERIRKAKGNVRTRKTDYLAYAILDSVIDHYFPVADKFGEELDAQDAALMNGEGFSLQVIHRFRGSLLELRRWLRPNREMVNQIIRDDSSRISEETKIYFRDCYDHVIHLQETLESYREVCSDLRDYHLSLVSNKTNDVMKTLTIVSTIFIPLGFIAGLYGMNFEVMPELKWRYGYYATLGGMATIAISFFVWFRRRGWF